jgi:hypothetical protein
MAGEGDPDDSSPSGTTDGAGITGRGGRMHATDPRTASASLARSREEAHLSLLRSWLLNGVVSGNVPRLGYGELRARGRSTGGPSTATLRSGESSMAARERLQHAIFRAQGLIRHDIPINQLQVIPCSCNSVPCKPVLDRSSP